MDFEDDSTFVHMVTEDIPYVETSKERAEIVPGPVCIVAHRDLHSYIRIFIWKNGKWLTIKYPLPTFRLPDGMLRLFSPQIDKIIEELRPFLKSLIFGKANLAYFIQGNDGRRTIIYRRRPLYCSIRHPLIVHRDELTFLRPAQGIDNVEVIWKGQQCTCLRDCFHIKLITTHQIVDLQLAKDEASLIYLEHQMKG